MWFGMPADQLVLGRFWAGVLICFQPEQTAQLSLWEVNEYLCHSGCSSFLELRIYFNK